MIQNISRQLHNSCHSTTSDLVRLRDGPLLSCTYNVPNTACDNLLCAACEISKATRRSPTIRSTHSAPPAHMLLKENMSTLVIASAATISFLLSRVGSSRPQGIAPLKMDIHVVQSMWIIAVPSSLSTISLPLLPVIPHVANFSLNARLLMLVFLLMDTTLIMVFSVLRLFAHTVAISGNLCASVASVLIIRMVWLKGPFKQLPIWLGPICSMLLFIGRIDLSLIFGHWP